MKTKLLPELKRIFWIAAGSAIFALGFDLFLMPHQFGAGGVSGLAVVIHALIPVVSVGVISLIVNIPLFIAGYRVVGRKFFVGSLAGMLISSVLIDVFVYLPTVKTEPLLGAIFGGLLVGGGCGIVLMQGASTGGVDIAARLMKYKFRELPIGKLMLMVD
ncbi:MAG: YitT family protein, partial [Oscillospiraceae bacterium]|nr:YitT family protein [Oscillospiraceae bacterium]